MFFYLDNGITDNNYSYWKENLRARLNKKIIQGR